MQTIQQLPVVFTTSVCRRALNQGNYLPKLASLFRVSLGYRGYKGFSTVHSKIGVPHLRKNGWMSTGLEHFSFARRVFTAKAARDSAAAAVSQTAHAHTKFPPLPKALVPIDGKAFEISAILLRDACQCPECVHESTNQRLFSTVDIPRDLQPRSLEVDPASDLVKIKWTNDVPEFSSEHTTTLSLAALRNLVQSGAASGSPVETFERPTLWPLAPSDLQDFDYEEYMHNDKALLQLMRQLRVHGLAFISNSPQSETSVSSIARRIGPIKDTFYGATWDVHTVPEAINAAYTSSDLGFHTDLLYFQQPAHIQLLHCVQSASKGGASVFSDAHKAAVDLFHSDFDAFSILATTPINYHYNHPEDNVYLTTKPVIELKPLRVGNQVYDYIEDYIEAWRKRGVQWTEQMLVDCLDKCNWGPPIFRTVFST